MPDLIGHLIIKSLSKEVDYEISTKVEMALSFVYWFLQLRLTTTTQTPEQAATNDIFSL